MAKILVPLVSSPLIGLLLGFAIMVILLNLIGRAVPRRSANLVRRLAARRTGATPDESGEGTSPRRINDRFRRLQVLSATYMALSHGSNDAQKTMGIMTLALYSARRHSGQNVVPIPVILLAATAMSLGTAAGGWRIMKTMGQGVVKLDPVHGFAAETSAASIILAASHFGLPVSTTHVISTAIMGTGSSDRFNAVRWGVAGNIFTAWVLTIPCAALIAAAAYFVLHVVGF